MAQFHIKTRTPVHIGSGEEFIADYDYLYFQKEDVIALIDVGKILDMLGGDDEGVDKLVSLIDKGESILDFLHQKYGNDLTAEKVAKITLPMHGPGPIKKESQQPIREQIQSADQSCIPGSSIKGAIRTALLSQYIDEDSDERRYGNQNFLTNRWGKLSDDNLQARHLGKDPNHDLFRLLQVGDASFQERVCTLARSINFRNNRFQYKDSIQQYVECIPAEAEGNIRIRRNELLAYTAGRRKVKDVVFKGRKKTTKEYDLYSSSKLDDMRLERLIFFTNQHTQIMIENELDFWENESYPNEVGRYLEVLEELNEELKDMVESRTEDRCMLRLGWGTGFLNMTGNWQENKMSDQMYDRLKREVRGGKYDRYPLPKTRRMAFDGTPFGFIELNRM